MSGTLKVCKTCQIIKNVDAFDKNRRCCKQCRKIKNSDYYENNKSRWRSKTKTEYEQFIYDLHKYERQCTADYKKVNKILAATKRILANRPT